MSKLPLTLACGDYDRTHALLDGSIQPDGIDLNYVDLPPAEIFWRQLRHQEFDASELSLSGYIMGVARGNSPFVAIPVFPSRVFRHSFIWVRADTGIETPKDLIGKRVGIPEYHMTAMLFIRGLLQHEYGVLPEQITWVRARTERVELNLPASIKIEDIGPDGALDAKFEAGELDAIAGTHVPRSFRDGSGLARRLFSNAREVELDYYRRTGIFPIMHTIAIRRELYERNRWIAVSLFEAFHKAKERAYARLRNIATGIYSLPWLHCYLEEQRQIFGNDPYAYGVPSNLPTLEAATLYSFEQGLSPRHVAVEELFAPETIDLYVPE